MTTVVLERVDSVDFGFPVRRITATGHAWNRDACIAMTFVLRTLAHVLEALEALEAVEQTAELPRFMIAWRDNLPVCAAIVDEVLLLLEQLAEKYPAAITIERRDAVRHDGDGLQQSA